LPPNVVKLLDLKSSASYQLLAAMTAAIGLIA